jgi:integrase/recombinase XerD
MSERSVLVSEYLAFRAARGFQPNPKLERLLNQFVGSLPPDSLDGQVFTQGQALAWAHAPVGAAPAWLAYRLSAVRQFAVYLAGSGLPVGVPGTRQGPGGSRRATPYLFTNADVQAVMRAAEELFTPLRAATMKTLVGVLAVTGMRIGEAIRLDRGDIDHQRGVLTVVESKFGKSRELAVHATTTAALRAYLARSDRPAPAEPTDAVFTSAVGTRLTYCNVHLAFKRIVAHAGLAPRSMVCRPRPHDLRHTFAVSTLLDAYRDDIGDGEHIQARIALLCTYLGHVNPGSTYWYLQAAPELLQLAVNRLELTEEGAR